jgi:hypothetical protein
MCGVAGRVLGGPSSHTCVSGQRQEEGGNSAGWRGSTRRKQGGNWSRGRGYQVLGGGAHR